MNLILFEDKNSVNFYPLSLSHAVFELLFGCKTIIDRFEQYFKPEKTVLVCRKSLSPLVSEKYGKQVNRFNDIKGDCLVLNASAIPSHDFMKSTSNLNIDTAIFNGDTLLAGRFSEEMACKLNAENLVSDLQLPEGVSRVSGPERKFDYLWDIVNHNCQAINDDLELFSELAAMTEHQMASKKKQLYIHSSANVPKSAHLDTSDGPIVIDEDVSVQPRSLIQGPAYIGPGSHVLGGIVREGCSLGPVCKIGGELEESILLGYSNKAHEGFIGHAYLGEWVNLGAMTTNSDLKNNYSEITVRLNGENIKTGSIKVGSFIGDHTKTGIGTLLNTGIVIGFCCNLYGGSLFLDREIGSYKWGTPDSLVDFKLEKAIELAAKVMSRRGVEFNETGRAVFEYIAINNKV